MGKVLVIGGGASGLMAGITAAEQGASVTILEADKKAASKLLRTGNGRCNFTNTGAVTGRYHGTDPSFAEQVVGTFTAEDTIHFFEEMGILPYRMGEWVYPHSETAASVANALLRRAKKLGIKMKYSERALSVQLREDGYFEVLTATWHYDADCVIVSCGTAASMKADFHAGLEQLPFGVRALPYRPTLCALRVSEAQSAKWAGVRVHARASLLLDGAVAAEEEGQIQFTADGISGIAVFNLVSLCSEGMQNHQEAAIELDLVPDYDEASLTAYFQNGQIDETEARLGGVIPEKLIPIVVMRVKRKEGSLPFVLKHFRVKVRGTAELVGAQVAAGGILTEQLDPSTMMVRQVPGFYMTGEMLDVDGACGGWNLQFAWASGYLAGKSAAAISSVYR